MSQLVHIGGPIRQLMRELQLLYIQNALIQFGWTPSQFRMVFPKYRQANPVEQYCHDLIGRHHAVHPVLYTEYLATMRRRAYDFLIMHPPVNNEDASPDKILDALVDLFDPNPPRTVAPSPQLSFPLNPAQAQS